MISFNTLHKMSSTQKLNGLFLFFKTREKSKTLVENELQLCKLGLLGKYASNYQTKVLFDEFGIFLTDSNAVSVVPLFATVTSSVK